MDAWISAFAVVSLFVVRLGVPIVAMVGLGIALHRLDRRWQREAADEAMRTLDVTAPVSPTAPLETPCWELKKCSPQKREKCPAAHNTALPCWLVRSRRRRVHSRKLLRLCALQTDAHQRPGGNGRG